MDIGHQLSTEIQIDLRVSGIDVEIVLEIDARRRRETRHGAARTEEIEARATFRRLDIGNDSQVGEHSYGNAQQTFGTAPHRGPGEGAGCPEHRFPEYVLSTHSPPPAVSPYVAPDDFAHFFMS
ncbi:hypothetical protein [Mesorhizobium australicum]|uniref:hypothetical protein n=1 Tax=Mesorhizobium australicum TaxID=536018 RepID=UPI003334C03A